MLNRIKVELPQHEYTALLDLASAELRSPDDQLRYMLRQEAQRRGLLPSPTTTSNNEEHHHEPTCAAA
jgi:hypothetical protein